MWYSPRVLAFVLAAWIAGAAPASAATPAEPVDGRRLLVDCEKRFLRVESLRGTTKTHSTIWPMGETTPTVEDSRSDFWYRRTDEIRFENAHPIPNTVVWNGKTLWIWSPSENAIVEEPAASAPLATRTMLSVHPGFGIDHLAPIPIDDFRTEAKPIADSTLGKDGGAPGDLVVTLTPLKNEAQRATTQVVVDPARHFVRRIVSRVNEAGAVISDVRFSDEVEGRPGTWFAKRVVTKQLLPDGSALESEKTYERLRFDAPIDDAKFRLDIPEGALRVRVVDVKARPSGPENVRMPPETK